MDSVSEVRLWVESRTIIMLPTRVAIEIGQATRRVSPTMCGRAAWISAQSWDGVKAIHVCTDPKGNGHVDRYTYSGGQAERQAGPMSEDQKAERRSIIANNKA